MSGTTPKIDKKGVRMTEAIIQKLDVKYLRSVIKIIEEHDEDDAEDAEEDFGENGLENHWVIFLDGKVAGVSGFRQIPESYGSAYLSWTYVSKKYIGKGYGKKIFLYVMEQIGTSGGNEVFIKLSTYQDEEGFDVYGAARKFYKSMGFKEQITAFDYYDEGEDLIMLSKQLVAEEAPEQILPEMPKIEFVDIFEIPGTVGSYSFDWKVVEKKLFEKRGFSAKDLITGLQEAKKRGGRKVFLTFPGNLPLVHEPLVSAGFKFMGELASYYEPGLSELHFSHNLDNID
jgi:ribosomal protein S18 acetylase RimI-like enzyme